MKRIALLLVILFAPGGLAARDGQTFGDFVDVELVLVDVVVEDGDGNPLLDLSVDDFRLYEDGRPVSELDGMPAAITGVAGRLGAVRAQMHLRTVLMHNDLKVVQKPEVMIPGSEAFEDGEFTHERYRDQVRRLLAALVESAS